MVGTLFAMLGQIDLLSVGFLQHPGGSLFGFLVTGLVIGAGTESANTAQKYFDYVKSKTSRPNPDRSGRGRARSTLDLAGR